MLSLLSWYLYCKRDLPWRDTKDPYKIWLSEIILQQTRVNQGLDYFNRFIAKYPSIFDLANASLDEILLLWQGLGYYSRARNLHETAINIRDNFKGNFPKDYNELLKLKGIGDYTAAAIASIAFGIPKAVVDGNVYRVLSRFFAEKTPIDTSAGRKIFKKLADSVLNTELPGVHNEAIMELGATICLPKTPKCNLCPINSSCSAHAINLETSFPVKSKKTKQKTRHLYFFVIKYKDGVYIEKRAKQDIWKGLYQFPIVEMEKPIIFEDLDSIVSAKILKSNLSYSIRKISDEYKHVLSHQNIFGKFIHVQIQSGLKKSVYQFILNIDIDKYAMPRLITRYLDENRI